MIVILLLALTSYIAYNLGKDKGKEISSDDTSQSQEDESQDSDTSSSDTSSTTTTTITTEEKPDPYEEWKTYRNDELHISFRYPSDWVIDDYQETNPDDFHISVNKGEGYNIDFSLYEDSTYTYCIYSDTDTSQIPTNELEESIESSEYTQVSSNYATFRRSAWDIYGSQIEHNLCKKNSENLYNTNCGNIHISYRVPMGEPDEDKIAELDKILKTFQTY